MAKKLGEVTNPITASGGSILSPSDWISRILFVAWIGAIFALGSKVLSAADKFVPGNYTPTGMQNSTGPSTIISSGPTVF
jgi:hypothetical protein